jgi:hypothetical protein
MKTLKFAFVFIYLIISSVALAQDDEAYMESLLRETVKVENPVYKPVVGFGVGMLNFYGEVHNNYRSSVVGSPGYKLNIASFIDKGHYLKTNFFLLLGSITVNQHSYKDTAQNLNFKTDLVAIGINVHYDFRNIIKKSFVYPFISVGIENIQFNSKTDLYYRDQFENNLPYHYWSDGTIRNISERDKYITPPNRIQVVQRDYNYETDLRDLNRNGLGSYAQSTLAIPFDFGLDFFITDRVNLRIGQTWHYTFTDNIDDVSYKSNIMKGDKRNDMFSFTYFTLHLDLFSDPKTKTIEKLFVDVSDNFDYGLFEDEDNDLIKDFIDKCPGTPYGITVDSVGCPLDDDKDGVPNYLDKQLNTPPKAIVDENGVEITPEALMAMLNSEAINRKDVDVFLLMHRAQSRYRGKSSIPIPEKFKAIDTDGDSYISFDELLKAIDNFFDFSSDFSSKDIYELQDFFFEQ